MAKGMYQGPPQERCPKSHVYAFSIVTRAIKLGYHPTRSHCNASLRGLGIVPNGNVQGIEQKKGQTTIQLRGTYIRTSNRPRTPINTQAECAPTGRLKLTKRPKNKQRRTAVHAPAPWPPRRHCRLLQSLVAPLLTTA